MILLLIIVILILILYFYIVTPVWAKSKTYTFSVSPSLLQKHVEALAYIDPPRNAANPKSLETAVAYIQEQWRDIGIQSSLQTFVVDEERYHNVIAEIGPKDTPLIVVGAHYDVCGTQPGADDNASAVAGLLELSRILSQQELSYRFMLVAFALEEPPHFATSSMGSAVHARSLDQKGQKPLFMVSLEMLGYFSDLPKSQQYPIPGMSLIYPSKGNFIALISDMSSQSTLQTIKKNMMTVSKVPVVSMSAPRSVTGIDFSDHRNYWPYKIPAMMLTDTAFFRNPHYHEPTDTPQTLDYNRMAFVVEAFAWAMLHHKK